MPELVDFIAHPQDTIIHKGKKVKLYSGSDQIQNIELHDLRLLSVFSEFASMYSYRGQSDEKWQLKTSFERFLDNATNRKLAPQTVEDKILREFKSQVHLYQNSLGYDPSSFTPIDIPSIIQHYGGPTRLLDFSDSFLIAALFSLVPEGTCDSAVYCIRNITINGATADINDFLGDIKLGKGVKLPPKKRKDNKIFLYVPEKINERLQQQYGHFMHLGSPSIPFEECLAVIVHRPQF